MSDHDSKPRARIKSIAGKKFGRLTAVAETTERNGKYFIWQCVCECGDEKKVSRRDLVGKRIRSCGCLQKEWLEKLHRNNVTHGGNGHELYPVYNTMIQRCYNSKNKKFYRYGGRGIKVCERWRASFPAFLEDMGERPTPRHTIDRRDNDGDYCPENCRWSTPKEQSNNTKRNIFLELDGVRKTMSEWSEITGIAYATLKSRHKRGWSDTEALTRSSER